MYSPIGLYYLKLTMDTILYRYFVSKKYFIHNYPKELIYLKYNYNLGLILL